MGQIHIQHRTTPPQRERQNFGHLSLCCPPRLEIGNPAPPYVEHIIEAFGWDRVVWGGSDSPVCTLNASLEQWVATTYALIQGTSEQEREKLFWRNAKRIWRLDI